MVYYKKDTRLTFTLTELRKLTLHQSQNAKSNPTFVLDDTIQIFDSKSLITLLLFYNYKRPMQSRFVAK